MDKTKMTTMRKSMILLLVLTGIFSLLVLVQNYFRKDTLFIPALKNTIVVVTFLILCVILGLIFYLLVKIRWKTNTGKVIKIVALITYSCLAVTAVFFALIITVFSLQEGTKFAYDGETYYYAQTGFPDLNITIYRRESPHSLFMKEVAWKAEHAFIGPINEETAIKILDGTMDKEMEKKRRRVREQRLDAADVEETVIEDDKKEVWTPQTAVDENITDIQTMENTSLGIVEVDRAGPSHLYYIVKNVDNQWVYVSEHPENAAFIEGAYENGTWKMTFMDTNGVTYVWYSYDEGVTREMK